jgi:small subunit ribosomal protein S19
MSRSLKKPLFINPKLQKKIDKLVGKINELEKQGKQEEANKIRNIPIKLHCRSSTIFPEMIGFMVEIYNGKKFFKRQITPGMVNKKLGEFAPTRQSGEHGKAGKH